MSNEFRTATLIGKTSLYDYKHNVLSAPNNRKALYCAGSYFSNKFLAELNSATTAFVGGGYATADTRIDAEGTDYELSRELTGAGPPRNTITKVTPLKIKNASWNLTMRNNDDRVATVTVFRVKPKALLPSGLDAIGSGTFTDPATMCLYTLANGMAASGASVNEVKTQGGIQIHDVVGGADCGKNMGAFYPSANMITYLPHHTIYQSDYWTSLFTVIGRQVFVMKPKDEVHLKINLPDVLLQDGYEPYEDATILMPEFGQFLLVQIVGHPAHIEQYVHATDVPLEAAAAPTTNRTNARIPSVNQCCLASVHIDTFGWFKCDMDIYDGSLNIPIKWSDIGVEIGGDNMDDTEYQVA